MSTTRPHSKFVTVLSCAGANDDLRSYPATLIIWTIAPVVLVLTLAAIYVVRTTVFKADRAHSRRQMMLGLMIIVYLVLPPICTVIFRGVPCARVARGRRLSVSRPLPVARR